MLCGLSVDLCYNVTSFKYMWYQQMARWSECIARMFWENAKFPQENVFMKMIPGPGLNIKISSLHSWDKTILRQSCLQKGISYTGNTTSLYWINATAIWSERTNCRFMCAVLYIESMQQRYDPNEQIAGLCALSYHKWSEYHGHRKHTYNYITRI